MQTTTLPADSGVLSVPLRGLTVDEYHAMGRAGILHEDDRVELLDGQLIAMSPLGGPHISVVNRLANRLAVHLAGRAVVSVQNSLRLDDRSEPEPDLVLLRPEADDGRVPTAEDARLVVEVADTTLRYDRGVKRTRYAQAGIPEVWVVALAERYVEVSRGPLPDGAFTETRRLVEGDALVPARFPDLTPIPVADLFAGL
jgi:Uma2 family endonuclease